MPTAFTRADGVLWTPLFVAFRLNCQEIGRTLLSRGADPHIGGRDGVLLTSIATMRFAESALPLSTRQTRATEWVELIGRARPYDIDLPVEEGITTRQAWSRAIATLSASAEINSANAVWGRVVTQSATAPVLVPGGEHTNADFPTPETGRTRPSETAVSRGLERVWSTYRTGGMLALTAHVQRCYGQRWPPETLRHVVRWNLEICTAMDLASSGLDQIMVGNRVDMRTPYFFDADVERRIETMRQFAPEGLVYSTWRRNLRRSVEGWMIIMGTAGATTD